MYEVDTDAIALKVKQESAAKDRKQTMKEDATKAAARTTKKAKVA
jgi:ParB family chromosome partitioning protein